MVFSILKENPCVAMCVGKETRGKKILVPCTLNTPIMYNKDFF